MRRLLLAGAVLTVAATAAPQHASATAAPQQASATTPQHAIGTWQGDSSCADCAGIHIQLTLMQRQDGSPGWYRLERTYKGGPGGGRVEHILGPWTLKDGSYLLRASTPADEYHFQRAPDGSLRELPDKGHPKPDLVLKPKPAGSISRATPAPAGSFPAGRPG